MRCSSFFPCSWSGVWCLKSRGRASPTSFTAAGMAPPRRSSGSRPTAACLLEIFQSERSDRRRRPMIPAQGFPRARDGLPGMFSFYFFFFVFLSFSYPLLFFLFMFLLFLPPDRCCLFSSVLCCLLFIIDLSSSINSCGFPL